MFLFQTIFRGVGREYLLSTACWEREVTIFMRNDNVFKSNLAEATQASMKAASEKNISLVDATYADITDFARLDAKWVNRIEGEESRGWVHQNLS